MEYAEREAYKKRGRELYRTGTTVKERAGGVFMVIEAHHARNPKAPSLDIYASHWLWARHDDEYDQEVMAYLTALYPPPKRPKIEKGYSDWNSYGHYVRFGRPR